MSLNPILNSVSAALAQQSTAVSVRSSAPVSVPLVNTPQTSDTSPSQPLLASANLLNASASFAQLGSLLEVAQSGTEQIGSILAQLQTLAQQAANGNGVTNLSSLDSAFQQILGQINQIVSGTKFGGTNLLDGTLSGSSGDGASIGSALSLPDLSTQSLFGSTAPNISTTQNATATLAAIATGQATVADAGTSISTVLSQLGFASASVSTALANNEAASSTLTESDLAGGTESGLFSQLLGNPSAGVQAQTGNLPASLLNLLQE